MADLEELVLKVGIKVDDEKLKKLRDELKQMEAQGASVSSKLGITPSAGGGASASVGVKQIFSVEILNSLKMSEKYLLEMLKILKSDHDRNTRITDSEFKGKEGLFGGSGGPIPFVNETAHLGVGSAIGGTLGAISGAFAGGNVLAGAGLGAALGQVAEKLLGATKEKAEALAKMFDERLTEDMDLRQLSYQSGETAENLYKLKQQAELAGTSLHTLIESNQRLSDDLIGGLSDKKAQLLMALNINPRQALIESGGDISKLNQMIYQRATHALQGANPYYRTSILSGLGYGAEEQNARRFVYRSDVERKAEEIRNVATEGGKVPIPTGEALQKQILSFRGAELEFLAGVRKALTAAGAAQAISVELMNIKAATVNVIGEAINSLGQTLNSKHIEPTSRQTAYPGEGAGAVAGQSIFNLFHSPASPSGSAKAGGAY